MLKARTSKQKGFTVVELLIVIVVLAVLATIAVTAYGGVQARARDSVRKNDLAQVKKVLNLYYTDHGHWIETGSGCGYNGGGQGWFSYAGGSYPASIASCLTSAGYTKEDMVDPSGGRTSSATSGYAYMKYHCGSGDTFRVYVYTKLESEPQSETATDGTCVSTLDTSYGMNYFVQVR